jgi:DNA-binding CsgD family transcriptional regulator
VNVRERKGHRDFGHMAHFDRVATFRSYMRNVYDRFNEADLERMVAAWDLAYPEPLRLAHNRIFRDLHLGDLVDGFRTKTLLTTSGTVIDREIVSRVQALLPGSTMVNPSGVRMSAAVGTEFRRLWDEYCPVTARKPPVAANTASDTLSDREREILVLLASGRSNGEIAAGLCLSTRTVERHARNIYTKLGVHNRSEATAYAVRNGLA